MQTDSNSHSRLFHAAWFAATFLAASAHAEFPQFGVLTRTGGAYPEGVAGIAVTGGGGSNSYVAGYFGATAAFGSTQLTNTSGYTNVFFAKFNPYGPLQLDWAKAPTTDGRVAGIKAAGTAVNPLFAGNFYGTNIVFGTRTLTNFGVPGAESSDIFLVSYDGGGGVPWLKQLGGTSGDVVKDAVGSQMNYYVGGWFQSPTFSAGSTSFTLLGTNGYDGFVIKYSTSGNVVWAQQGINAGVNVVAYDKLNNVYAAGTVLGAASFGGLSLSNQTEGTFATKFDSSGSPVWIRGDMNIGTAMTVDKELNIVTAGTFSNTVQFGQTVLSNGAAATIYVAKFDSAGEALWARQLAGLGNDQVTAITVDIRTNYWITGSFRSPDLSSEHGFVACFDMVGQLLGVTQVGGATGSVIADVDNFQGLNNLICGRFATNLAVSGLTLTNGGNDEVFIGRLLMAPPRLDSTVANNSVILSWPVTVEGYSNAVLESAVDISAGTWGAATNVPSAEGGMNYVTNSAGADQGFFRLKLQPK